MKYLKQKVFFVTIIFFILFSSERVFATDDLTLDEVKQAYPIWYKAFESDYRSLSKRIHENKSAQAISKEEINVLFKNSVEPDSKMIELLFRWALKGRTQDHRNSDFMIYSPGSVLILLLQAATPTGVGGAYQPQRWAIYIDVEEYSSFNPYAKNKVPENGKLVRDVYPFMIFKKVEGRLMLESLSKEFGEILNRLVKAQFL